MSSQTPEEAHQIHGPNYSEFTDASREEIVREIKNRIAKLEQGFVTETDFRIMLERVKTAIITTVQEEDRESRNDGSEAIHFHYVVCANPLCRRYYACMGSVHSAAVYAILSREGCKCGINRVSRVAIEKTIEEYFRDKNTFGTQERDASLLSRGVAVVIRRLIADEINFDDLSNQIIANIISRLIKEIGLNNFDFDLFPKHIQKKFIDWMTERTEFQPDEICILLRIQSEQSENTNNLDQSDNDEESDSDELTVEDIESIIESISSGELSIDDFDDNEKSVLLSSIIEAITQNWIHSDEKIMGIIRLLVATSTDDDENDLSDENGSSNTDAVQE